MKVAVEVTDTFGGEANYSWVKRKEMELLDALSNYAVVRRVKKEIGWSGKRCLTVNYGDMIELRPYGECQVAFINFAN
jgi:hypothetical protein